MLLDTREKIVPLRDLPARLGNGRWIAVVGRFDPLTLAQAQRVAQLNVEGRSVLGVIEPGDGCLLPAEARAALVASLRSVQLVVIAEVGALPSHPQMEIVEDGEGERSRSAEFARLIRERQAAR